MATIGVPPHADAPAAPLTRRRRFGDRAFRWTTLVVSVGLVVMLALLLWVLADGGWRAIREFGLHFVIGRDWNPVAGRETYGALPFIFGTAVTSLIAMVLAMPIGVGVALFLNESGAGWIKNPLAVLVDLLAAIPSVVYGLWGLFVVVPAMRPVANWLFEHFGWIPFFGSTLSGPGLAPAALVLAIMVLPTVAAVSQDALRLVPYKVKEAAYGMGATRWEAILKVMLPAASTGIFGAVVLGFGRALGETMALAMLIGNSNQISLSIFSPANTLAALLALNFPEAGPREVQVLMYAALVLLAITLVVNLVGEAIMTISARRAGVRR